MKITCRKSGWNALCVMSLVAVMLVLHSPLQAQENEGIRGWEKGGAYDRLYNAKELEKIRATVVGIKEVVPMDGMSPGVALEVKESEEDKEVILVHICPQAYMDKKSIGIKPRDRIKIRGAWAEIKGNDVFIASKIKRGDFFELKVRLTKDGTPFWSMSPEQREKASK